MLETGISFERIPRIQEMNDILGRIGWGAVAVDGFIPPAAFMEFQAYKVLVIACDMRQIHHIEYTPAPDIVHEAAGHAPIIVDQEYSLATCSASARSARKAMQSKKDFELYEAIRHLSILKELPNFLIRRSWPQRRSWSKNGSRISGTRPRWRYSRSPAIGGLLEHGLLSVRIEQPKIYGAGLLSSIGESVSCLEPNVKKAWYSVDAANTAFDITTKQPQLFVCRDFQHLTDVLEEFANGMAFRTGGLAGINKAIACKNTTTCQYSSGLQVSGAFTEVLEGENGTPVYLRTTGPSALAFAEKELAGHGSDYHAEGFGSPIGRWRNTSAAPETLSDDQLRSIGIDAGKKATITFESGVVVSGRVEKILHQNGKLVLITFSNCSAKLGDRVLFDPAWGIYDMAVGERISSVFNGCWSGQRRLPPRRASSRKSARSRFLLMRAVQEAGESLYQQVRDIRERKLGGYERLGEIWETQQAEHADDWLLSMEIFEILDEIAGEPEGGLKQKIVTFLNERKLIDPDKATLIEWGFRLVTYHKADLQTAS